MFVLSSDYDGTLKTRVHDLRINIQEINKFRGLGNIFILNTGRPFVSISKEITKFNIPFDYLCCHDGAIIFDKNSAIIKKTTLTNEQTKYIKNLILKFPSLKILRYYSTTQVEKNEISTPVEIEIIKDPQASFDDFNNLLKQNIDKIETVSWKNSLYVKNSCSKSTALVEIAKLIDPSMDPATIYTIGDEPNDLDMIKNHHGFRMLESSPKLMFSTWRIVPEVHHLVKYLNFKSKRTK